MNTQVNIVLHQRTFGRFPACVGDDGLSRSIRIGELKSGNPLWLTGWQKGSEIPAEHFQWQQIVKAISELNADGIDSVAKQGCHIVSRIVDPLAEIGPGRVQYIV